MRVRLPPRQPDININNLKTDDMITNIEMETLTMAKSALNKYIAEKINWEQRRYEIAKDVFCHHMLDSQVPTTEAKVQIAVELADRLIEELKKKK